MLKHGAGIQLASCLFLLCVAPVAAAECPLPGEPIQWIADYCMATLETDDEIAASACIDSELTRVFPDDCAARRHYKRALCQLAMARGTTGGTVEDCLADEKFMGSTVANGGVGN